jgi:hypothetical protein
MRARARRRWEWVDDITDPQRRRFLAVLAVGGVAWLGAALTQAFQGPGLMLNVLEGVALACYLPLLAWSYRLRRRHNRAQRL